MEIDRGIRGFPPEKAPCYHAVGHLFFNSIAELDRALEKTAATLVADEPNYAPVQSIVHISEVVA